MGDDVLPPFISRHNTTGIHSKHTMARVSSDVLLPEGVTWTQDNESVEVSIAVAEDAVRSDLHVVTTVDSLRVQHRAGGTVWRPLLLGSLWRGVDGSSCCWSVEKRRGGGKAVVIQLEKEKEGKWDTLLRANASGSILEELGRDQVIEDAGADTDASVTCGRCGALVKRSRMEAHTTMWCEALQDADEGVTCPEPASKSPAAHLFWSQSPTAPEGSLPPKKLPGGSDTEVLV